MKTTLLFIFGLFTCLASAQFPINEYYGHKDIGDWFDGNWHRTYYAVTSSVPLDNSPSGANATWNFTTLTQGGFVVYDNAQPTTDEITGYPGTTMTTTSSNGGKMYTVMNQAITGLSSVAASFNLSYTNSAILGTFPLSFGYSNTDATAGNYTYDTYSGTFSGSMATSVDAYGTLTLGDGVNNISESVTRLKTVQSINLNYGIITNVGTATITSYHYYRMGDLFPFFTSVTMTINVPLLSLDQTVTTYEAAVPAILGTPELGNTALSLAPNPVRDLLTIQTEAEIGQVTITDTNGRIVMTTKAINGQADLSALASGVYFARIETDQGSLTRKIVKQ